MTERVARYIWKHPTFQDEYRKIRDELVLSEFDKIVRNHWESLRLSWIKLLNYAHIFAATSDREYLDAALRIVHASLKLAGDSSEIQAGSAYVLNHMWNRPTIDLAQSKKLLPSPIGEMLPWPAKFDWTYLEELQSISIGDNNKIRVNKFQNDLWKYLQENDWVSFSAPTSVGKSYILYHWILEKLEQEISGNILMIVPTRALITQCSDDLRRLIANAGQINQVFTVPGECDAEGKRSVYVFTQERLYQHFITSQRGTDFSLIIVDEAHKVGDAQRGVFLQLALERLMIRNIYAQYVFSSPLTDNPDKLLRHAPNYVNSRSLKGHINTVNQNLIWVKQEKSNPKRWEILNVDEDGLRDIGRIRLDHSPRNLRSRFADVAYSLGQEEPGNVVYVNGPNEAEQISYLFVGQMSAFKIDADDLEILAKAIEKTIHRHYSLAKFVRHGVAFHYGIIPQNIRGEVERLFKEGYIKYLVATSTLVEGVNLACRNIFLRGPKTGNDLMSAGDFWNLAGRAGRWGKEFQGNIVCIDPYWERLWQDGEPPRSRKNFTIWSRAETLLRNPEKLRDFVDKGGIPQNAGEKDLESVWHYLCAQYIEFESLAESFAGLYLAPGWVSEFESVIANEIRESCVESSSILRNPGISINAMNEMYRWCAVEIRGGRHEELVPPDPASEDAVERYAAIFNSIKRRMGAVGIAKGGSGSHKKDKRALQIAILSAFWMRGVSLPDIIDRRLGYEEKQGRKIDVNKTIRETMRDIEQCVRFEVPKYLSAYTDIVGQCCDDYGVQGVREQLTDFTTRLEFGVATTTELSLVSLGASRSAAMMAVPYLRADELGKSEVRDELKKIDWEITDIPKLILKEITEIAWGDQKE